MTDKEIEIVFCHPLDHSDEISLHYNIASTPIAQKYFEAMQEVELQGYGIKDKDRFYNFPHCHKNEAWMVEEMNQCINVINTYAPGSIVEHAHIKMNQGHMNVLHRYFEMYRGGVLTPKDFFTNAPQTVKRALEDYNLLIHRYEDFARKKRFPLNILPWPANRRATLAFNPPRPRYPLADEDYQHFSTQTPFGSLQFDYCEVGKSLLDVFDNKDDIVGDDNIRPLRYYSADTIMRFRSPYVFPFIYAVLNWLHRTIRHKQFKIWWKKHAEKLADLGFIWGDPKNSIGYITVAHLNRNKGSIAGLSVPRIIDLLGHHQHFKCIHCHDPDTQ